MNGRHPFRFRALAIATTCATLALPPGASSAAEAAATADVSASPPASVTNRVWKRAQDLAIFALGLIGVDYRFGGSTPEAGLDCSGLVGYVFQQVTGITLPRTSQELSRMGRRVTVADLKVGDLVFFNTRSLPFSHVGIYLGEDRFVHAPSRGGEVEIVSLSANYWRTRFSGARRLAALSTETQLAQDPHAAGNALPRLPSTATSLPSLIETLADTAN
jgi:cell wall-associated NlpC family hydrolase